MNGKQAKRMRGLIRRITNQDPALRKYDTGLVPSQRGYSVTVNKGKADEIVYKDKAIQVRLLPGVPRSMYQELKQNVQTNRHS